MFFLAWLWSLEILTSWGIFKFFSDKKIENILITGNDRQINLPVIDSQIQKLTHSPTKNQQRIVTKVTSLIRYLSNTKVLEYVILWQIQKNWPGKKILDKEVTIII